MMNRDEIEQFFNKVALQCSVSDLHTVRSVYYGVVKAITSDLLKGLPVDMPEFGSFHIHVIDEHDGVSIATGERVKKKRSAVLRFRPCRAIKLWCQNAKIDSIFKEEA
jgi:nucleoid DNA-binding protein